MARFLPRSLRSPREHGMIDGDFPCPTCGYNLRGLIRGRNCPECGQAPPASQPIFDALLSCDAKARARWQIGLGVASACVFVAMAARVMYFVAGFAGTTPTGVTVYAAIGGANSIAWIVAVWMVTPRSLEERWKWLGRLRVAARGLSLLWLVGYTCLALRQATTGNTSENIALIGLAGRFLGGVGAMIVVFILSWVAEEAEIERPARRLNVAVWLLWIPTLLAQIFPTKIAWFTLVPLGMVLFVWCWVMALLGLGLFALYRHVRWGGDLAVHVSGRGVRIDERRRELDESVEATIRPAPPGRNTELPLE